MNNLFFKIKLLKRISILKSLYWSFKLFPWKLAIRIPLFVYPNTVIKVSGIFILHQPRMLLIFIQV